MKWRIEYITDESCNILIINDDEDVVGMGFPLSLAERLVDVHNGAIDQVRKEIK